MSIELDHIIVPAKNQRASAKLLAEILGVEWAESGTGPFSPVYVSQTLTLDFINDEGALPIEHYCFKVSEDDFDLILKRIKALGIDFRSSVRGENDNEIGTAYGGRMV